MSVLENVNASFDRIQYDEQLDLKRVVDDDVSSNLAFRSFVLIGDQVHRSETSCHGDFGYVDDDDDDDDGNEVLDSTLIRYQNLKVSHLDFELNESQTRHKVH